MELKYNEMKIENVSLLDKNENQGPINKCIRSFVCSFIRVSTQLIPENNDTYIVDLSISKTC